MENNLRLIIVSGRSGSGKSTALHALEDEGFYCIDNLPASLLPELVEKYTGKHNESTRLAVGIDARNMMDELQGFTKDFEAIRNNPLVDSEIVFFDADKETLIKRFSMTRRMHPMSQEGGASLDDAIREESTRLESISSFADIRIDTSKLSVHALRFIIRKRIAGKSVGKINLLFQSFGFKYGLPPDADFVFDVRCLPNPYWIESLREFTGCERPVIDYLKSHGSVLEMKKDIYEFVNKWIPEFQDGTRSYMTIAIGCTGGKHRSVFLCEELSQTFQENEALKIMVRHREQQF